ncbi:unnamed protein product [Ilex paraguariensis]|uniref:Ubiquitin-like-conjugating enzyme ATG10 n=1 Tax=Ilex paraguariensis TaxID=185542 RepID=A0ABC8R377_9AQUA
MVSNQAIIDMSSWDGTLSSIDFRIAACAFAEKWKKFNSALPQWSWVPCPKRPWISAHQVEGYLTLENVFLPSFTEEHDESSPAGKEICSCSDKDELFIDTATLSCGHEVHHYNFHVTYSPSYRVPVLYFYAYSSDGQPLMLDDIEKDLPANSGKLLLESKWTFITQEVYFDYYPLIVLINYSM